MVLASLGQAARRERSYCWCWLYLVRQLGKKVRLLVLALFGETARRKRSDCWFYLVRKLGENVRDGWCWVYLGQAARRKSSEMVGAGFINAATEL